MGDVHPPVFRVELLPALNGDCIWVEYGTPPETRHVLIDGGPLKAFGALTARIGKLGQGPRQLELFVITHIDDDHIAGAVKLLNHSELNLAFRDIWFNGWEQLSYPITGAGSATMKAEAERSPAQGQYLALRIEKRNEPWNRWFFGRAAMVPDEGLLPRVRLNGDLELILLSPNAKKLLKLQAAWAKSIRSKFKREPDDKGFFRERLDQDVRYRGAETIPVAPDSVAQAIATDLEADDDSVPNGSSIAFVAQYGGKRCAFLGDAHIDVVEPALARLAKEMGVKRVPLDAVKLSHHGSDGNITASFLKAIDCRRFLVSTDGSKFDHPDDPAIECILNTVPGARLYFNYRSQRNAKWERECEARGHTTVYPGKCGEGVSLDLLVAD